MLKAEELKILEQIEKLIDHAGADSYIRMTFAGVPEVCRNNIVNDFGDIPVRDLEEERKRHEDVLRIKDAECGQKLLKLEHERDVLQKHVENLNAEIEKLGHMCESKDKQLAECRRDAEGWERNAHDAGELYCELEKECAEKDAEIMRLKAELYDYMKGAKSNG